MSRRLHPQRIIFVRHAQSEANADKTHTIIATKRDHVVSITKAGVEQAVAASAEDGSSAPSFALEGQRPHRASRGLSVPAHTADCRSDLEGACKRRHPSGLASADVSGARAGVADHVIHRYT